MALRLMQVLLPGETDVRLDELLEGRAILGSWRDDDGTRTVVQLVLPADETEPVTDRFEERFGSTNGFHIVLFPIEALLPEAPTPELEGTEDEASSGNAKQSQIGRVSREELHADVVEGLATDRGLLSLAALSAVVAAVGLIRNDVAVIIGAMVIAPLLGPNIALSLGTTLGDIDLIRRGLRTNLAGAATALALAVAIGLTFDIDASGTEIASRTEVDFGNIVLALGAGAAGTLAYTRGLSGAVIGVMVAVALMPPLVTCGMLVGEGEMDGAGGALLLALANFVGVNLAATGTFVVQGVRPRRWWDAERAKRSTIQAIAMWAVLLAVLAALLLLAR